MPDTLENRDRIYLEKLRLATEIILGLAEEPQTISDALESELWLLKDRLERSLLQA